MHYVTRTYRDNGVLFAQSHDRAGFGSPRLVQVQQRAMLIRQIHPREPSHEFCITRAALNKRSSTHRDMMMSRTDNQTHNTTSLYTNGSTPFAYRAAAFTTSNCFSSSSFRASAAAISSLCSSCAAPPPLALLLVAPGVVGRKAPLGGREDDAAVPLESDAVERVVESTGGVVPAAVGARESSTRLLLQGLAQCVELDAQLDVLVLAVVLDVADARVLDEAQQDGARDVRVVHLDGRGLCVIERLGG